MATSWNTYLHPALTVLSALSTQHTKHTKSRGGRIGREGLGRRVNIRLVLNANRYQRRGSIWRTRGIGSVGAVWEGHCERS